MIVMAARVGFTEGQKVKAGCIRGSVMVLLTTLPGSLDGVQLCHCLFCRAGSICLLCPGDRVVIHGLADHEEGCVGQNVLVHSGWAVCMLCVYVWARFSPAGLELISSLLCFSWSGALLPGHTWLVVIAWFPVSWVDGVL